MTTSVQPSRTTVEAKWVLTLASVGSFMVALDGLVVMTALSTIRRDLHASPNAGQLLQDKLYQSDSTPTPISIATNTLSYQTLDATTHNERYWPYVEKPEEPTTEELAALDPDLYATLFGQRDLPFSITLVFPPFDVAAPAAA